MSDKAEDRARQAMRDLLVDYGSNRLGNIDDLVVQRFASAIREAQDEARREENESCAKLMEQGYAAQGKTHWYNEFAAAIRARAGKEG